MLKMVFIFLVVAGVNLFTQFGFQTPSFWEWTQANKFYACLMTFFLCNAIEGQLISTGAFEILLNGDLNLYFKVIFKDFLILKNLFNLDVPLWSKLETGRIPQPQELFQMIDNHLNLVN